MKQLSLSERIAQRVQSTKTNQARDNLLAFLALRDDIKQTLKGFLTRTVESDADFAGRVAESVKEQMAPVRDVALLAAQENRKRREAENTAAEYRKRNEPLLKPLQGLSAGQLEDVLKLANRYQQENDVERQERVAHARPRGRKGR